jgi:hypothetical protein
MDRGKVSSLFYNIEILIYILLIIPTLYLTFLWWKYYRISFREIFGFTALLTASWILYAFIRAMSKRY